MLRPTAASCLRALPLLSALAFVGIAVGGKHSIFDGLFDLFGDGPEPRAATLDSSLYRVRCVSYGLPPGGFSAMMAVTAPYYESGVVAFPEGVVRELFLTTPDNSYQFIILFFEERAEAAIKAQYGTDTSDAAWQALETGAKAAGFMSDPVQFSYMDAAALYGADTPVTIPAPGSIMPPLPGWPAAFPSIAGAIVQSDAPVNANGVYEGVALSAQWQ